LIGAAARLRLWLLSCSRRRLDPELKPVTRNRRLCGARTRTGRACLVPARPNGRCRMHGGLATVEGHEHCLRRRVELPLRVSEERGCAAIWARFFFVAISRAGPEYAVVIDNHLLVLIRHLAEFIVHGREDDMPAPRRHIKMFRDFAIDPDDRAVIEKDQLSPLIIGNRAPPLRLGSIGARYAEQ
jgi:hypothetical protein